MSKIFLKNGMAFLCFALGLYPFNMVAGVISPWHKSLTDKCIITRMQLKRPNFSEDGSTKRNIKGDVGEDAGKHWQHRDQSVKPSWARLCTKSLWHLWILFPHQRNEGVNEIISQVTSVHDILGIQHAQEFKNLNQFLSLDSFLFL